MRISRFWRVAAFVGALSGSAALVAVASGATGAYFNDTHSGTLTGTIGSIKVTTSGGSGTDGLDFNFANMLPGVMQTVTAHYVNTGTNAEDVYLVFPNAPALHSVNDLGGYGAVQIKSNGNQVFYSNNLDDGQTAQLTAVDPTSSHCSSSPSATVPLSPSGCWPVPNTIKLASNVAPGQGGTMSFGFAFGAKLSGTAFELAQAFCYPLVQVGSNPTDQQCVTTGQQHGLPYEIVATQPGVAPNNPLNSNPTP